MNAYNHQPNFMKQLTLTALIFFLFFQPINAQETQASDAQIPKRIYTTKTLGKGKAPVIDGIMDDESWSLVDWDSDFTEWRPDENTAPSHQTKFKILYDQKYLYIGIRALDKHPDSIVKRLSRRDGFEGDWVEVNIDSYHDLRTGFSFTFSAAGVKGDEFISDNGNNWDESWNPVWFAKSKSDNEGYSVEMKIPLSQLRFGKSKEQIWGLQVQRRFFRKEERSVWQRVPQDAPGWISEFGELHGLIDLEPQKQLEIQPFGLAKLDTYPKEEGNPFRDGSDFKLNGGLDAKIGITNDLTLDLTVNPDFGQVEADPAAIALDGFEIFFNERRPFFVENNNIFNYQISNSEAGDTFGSDNLFFSRRIGRSPQGYPDTEDGEFVNQPNNTSILGAAKFSGKTKNGWSIGVLESVTANEYATIDNNGDRRKELVEPLTNYFLGRLQKDFNERNTFIGGIFTATNRNLTDNLQFLHKAAYTGGLDFKHQWNDRAWYVGGNVVFSRVEGSKEAIQNTQESLRHLFGRVDASHLEVDPNKTSLTGTGGNIQIGKQAKGHWRFESGFTWRSPELELNDMGFQRQADDLRHYTWIGYRTLKPFSVFRQLGLNYNHWSAWDFEGNHNVMQFNTNSWAQFKNNWFANLGITYLPTNQSTVQLRGGPRIKNSQMLFYFTRVSTDDRKKVSFRLSSNGGKTFDDSFSYYRFGAGVSYQPTNALQVSIYPEYRINDDKLQFIENIEYNNETNYVNGTIAQRTLSMSMRLNYTINPNLTIQYYGEPFISRGRYSEFKTVVNPQADSFKDRIQLFNTNQITLDTNDDSYLIDSNTDGTTDYQFGNPDFSYVQFRSNLVMRWEYIPGSEVFLVWSQGVSGNADPEDKLFKGLDNQILGEKKDNTFLIKVTYRFML